MAECKRCKTTTVLAEDEIEKMVKQVTKMKGIRLVDEKIYNSRIEKCLECEKLEYGTTCMLCGCVMQVRARLSDGRCSYPKNRKW